MMIDYATLNMIHSLGFMMLIIGALLLLTAKSPSPSPSDTPSISSTQSALGWSRIGYYSALIGIALVIIISLIRIVIVDYTILNIANSLGFMMLAGGMLLLLTTKSPSPSPSDAPNLYDWPRIGYYSALIGIALIVIISIAVA